MNRRIGPFSLGEKGALGFDTALDAQAFAQAKLASFITSPGRIVYPGGGSEDWLPGGVIEREGAMTVWGPPFPGEGLDVLVSSGERRDEALDALRRWIAARHLFPEDCPWPAGVLAAGPGGEYPPGTLLFLPSRLVKRCLEAEGPGAWLSGAEQWIHPDLSGPEGAAFTAGALLYRIVSGKAPFPRDEGELLRQDIREGVFLPPRLAAPGLEEEVSALISAVLAPVPKGQEDKRGAVLEKLEKFMGPPGFRTADSFIRPLGAEEQAALEQEGERFNKRKDLTVKTRRFVIRNTAIITGIFIVLLTVGLITQSILQNRASLPTTRGMNPVEVTNAYYGAFGDLDHQLMDACVVNKAGKDDVTMIINFFVMNRVRQAYEMDAPGFIPVQKWLDAGSPEVRGTVFGVSDLRVVEAGTSAEPGEIRLRASYRLWLPDAAPDGEEEGGEPDTAAGAPSRVFSYTDDLRLILRKGAWRIAEISRREG